MKNKELHPFVPPEATTRDITVPSVVLGVLLAIVFCASNAYLGLRVGMTISTSIPVAVISMLTLKMLSRGNRLLENNMVQTIASAGGVLASGMIFTIPAVFLWSKEGLCQEPAPFEMTVISLAGGIAGVICMVPFRRQLMVVEHGKLAFPEGTACAQVLLSEEKKGGGPAILMGAGMAAVFKLLIDGCNVISSKLVMPIRSLHTQFSAEPYPALIGVGYICGLRTCASILSGGILSWFVLIPAICYFGGNSIILPETTRSILDVYAAGGPELIWKNYVRYIGTGAIASAGLLSLIRTIPSVFKSFAGKTGKSSGKSAGIRTERNIPTAVLLPVAIAIPVLVLLCPAVKIGVIGTLLFVVCGFCFSVVAARIAGMIGCSNLPASGMTLASLLVAALVLLKTGHSGIAGMLGAITVATLCCTAIATSGDISQDLKTGTLLGATPAHQQIGQIIGVIATAGVIAWVLYLLDNAWGFGSDKLPAPQANLMKMVTEGVMAGTMPWTLVIIGIFVTLILTVLGISPMSVALGTFLPFSLSMTLVAGGLIRALVDRVCPDKAEHGTLFCSGLITGEGLMGISLALLTVSGRGDAINLSGRLNLGNIGAAGTIALTMLVIFAVTRKSAAKQD